MTPYDVPARRGGYADHAHRRIMVLIIRDGGEASDIRTARGGDDLRGAGRPAQHRHREPVGDEESPPDLDAATGT